MGNEWQPVVGGRAMLHGEPCLVMALTGDARAEVGRVGRVGWGLLQLVPLSDLTEHPDDARHRRLLEAAREATRYLPFHCGSPVCTNCNHRAVGCITLRAIVAEIDQAEADHAS